LTTMAVDKAGMGRLAVTLLAHRLDVGKECVTATLVRPQLIERETVLTLEPKLRLSETTPILRTEAQPVESIPAGTRKGSR